MKFGTDFKTSRKSNKWLERIAKPSLLIIGAIIIFWFGLSIGSGRIQIGLSQTENKSLPKNLNYSSVDQVYNALRQNYDGKLNVNNLLDGLKHGLAQSVGDPYTDYFTPKEAKDFNNQLNGTFEGIGAELNKDADGNLKVVSPIAGYPAEKAGLKTNDIIVSINNAPTSGMSLDQAVSKIHGPKGTSVILKILRNKSQSLSLTITRTDIKIPSVDSKILINNIGYMKINEFSDDTGSLALRAVNNFKHKAVKAVILDLRGNPGGALNAAVDVSSLWLQPGKTVLTTRRQGIITDTYYAQGDPILSGIPTVVLIDESSASASEITAGALHDNKVATLIGVKSYGKGVVQSIINLEDGAILKVTTARWYTPSGKNIDKAGITPDQLVKNTDNDIKAGKDPQLDAATAFLNK